jgi:hypothetical protein
MSWVWDLGWFVETCVGKASECEKINRRKGHVLKKVILYEWRVPRRIIYFQGLYQAEYGWIREF